MTNNQNNKEWEENYYIAKCGAIIKKDRFDLKNQSNMLSLQKETERNLKEILQKERQRICEELEIQKGNVMDVIRLIKIEEDKLNKSGLNLTAKGIIGEIEDYILTPLTKAIQKIKLLVRNNYKVGNENN